jgi:hypothetical protein
VRCETLREKGQVRRDGTTAVVITLLRNLQLRPCLKIHLRLMPALNHTSRPLLCNSCGIFSGNNDSRTTLSSRYRLCPLAWLHQHLWMFIIAGLLFSVSHTQPGLRRCRWPKHSVPPLFSLNSRRYRVCDQQ